MRSFEENEFGQNGKIDHDESCVRKIRHDPNTMNIHDPRNDLYELGDETETREYEKRKITRGPFWEDGIWSVHPPPTPPIRRRGGAGR